LNDLVTSHFVFLLCEKKLNTIILGPLDPHTPQCGGRRI